MRRLVFYQYIKAVRVGIFLLLFFLLFLAAFSEMPFDSWKLFKAQIVKMAFTIQPAPSITTSEGEVITPTQSESQQFEAGSGGTFIFVNPQGSSVKIVFSTGTTQVTLDFFIDAYEKSPIIADDRPLPTGKNIVGGLIYEIRAFEGTTEITTFDASFIMTVHYLEEQLGNFIEETLGVYFWDDSQSIWTAFDIDSRDTEQNTITVIIDHLTLYAILGEEKEAVVDAVTGVGPIPFNPFIPQEEIPITQPERKIGDINNDGKVDILDFNILMVRWGETGPNNTADINRDELVGVLDVNLLMVHWTG